MSLTTGEIIEGKYRIVRLIGEGGMGAVYEGENTRIRRRVAIKVLHQAVAENHEAVQRFEREAQAAGRIGNDHILEVIDLGSLQTGDHFMVMEYLDGEPLSDRIRRLGRMRPEDLTPLVLQALEGLRAAHEAGIVHRDLKPDNVFILKEKVGQHDFVKLIDFGISKFQPVTGNEMKMTRTGTVMGTPYYMSPEQASGSREADHRSDLYAIGVIMYEAVTGRVPFDAPTFNQLLFQIVLSDPPAPQEVVPELNPAFANIIAKAMARDVEFRFQSTEDFAKALREWLTTGASVSIPPAGDVNALLPPGTSGAKARLASDSGAGARQTGVHESVAEAAMAGAPARRASSNTAGSWATSQVEGIPKSRGPLVALGVVGVLMLGGLGIGGYLLSRSGASAAGSSSATTVVEVPSVVPEVTADSIPSSDIQALQPSVVPVPDAAAPRPSAVASASASAGAPIGPRTAGVGAARRSTARQHAPTPVTAKPHAPKPSTPSRPSGGSVDFGY